MKDRGELKSEYQSEWKCQGEWKSRGYLRVDVCKGVMRVVTGKVSK